MTLKIISLVFFIFLLSGCEGETDDKNTVTIQIFTTGLGKEGEKFPQELIELWNPIDMGDKQIAPKINLVRIDQPEEIALSILDSGSIDAKTEWLISSDQEVILSNQQNELKNKKIDSQFSIDKPSDFQIANERILSKYKSEDTFYLKSNIYGIKSFNESSELLDALKKRMSQNNNKNQEYVIVYNLAKVKKEDKPTPKPEPVKVEKTVEPKVTDEKPNQAKTEKPSDKAKEKPSTESSENKKNDGKKSKEKHKKPDDPRSAELNTLQNQGQQGTTNLNKAVHNGG